MKLRITLLFFLLFLICFYVYSQEELQTNLLSENENFFEEDTTEAELEIIIIFPDEQEYLTENESVLENIFVK